MQRDIVALGYSFFVKKRKQNKTRTEPKTLGNVENCEKTPTIKQFSYYFVTITKWEKKVFFFLFLVMWLIQKTGAMLNNRTDQQPHR